MRCSLAPFVTSLILVAVSASGGCATTPSPAVASPDRLRAATQRVADDLRAGDDRGLASVLDPYGEVRVYVTHTAVDPPLDVVGQLLVGAGAVATWARLLHRDFTCADPDTCPWRAFGATTEPGDWGCEGACCAVDVTTTDHRVLYLERVCFSGSPPRLSAIHLVDGD